MVLVMKIGEVVILVVVNYDENDNDDFKFPMTEKKKQSKFIMIKDDKFNSYYFSFGMRKGV